MNISLVPRESLSSELSAPWTTASEGGKAFIQSIAHAPNHAERLLQYYNGIRFGTVIGPRLCEILRLTIGSTTGCRTCLKGRLPAAFAAGLTEEQIRALTTPDETTFSDRELAVIDYAHKFGTDHSSIGAADYLRLGEYFNEEAIIEIGMLCAQFLGFGRLVATLDLEDTCALTGTLETY